MRIKGARGEEARGKQEKKGREEKKYARLNSSKGEGKTAEKEKTSAVE